jgi:cysteinyl-tRNA synthetase
MKLTDLNKSQGSTAKKALKEHFNTELNFSRLSLNETSSKLKKIQNLISEMKLSKAAHTTERNAKFMKLVFMEQALSEHKSVLQKNRGKFIIENQEVERSQVLLAAQDMVDSLQKMVEDISDMLVKELPAVSDRASSEIGEMEGQQFTQQASEGLGALQAALIQAKASMQAAVGSLTGKGQQPGAAFAPDTQAGAMPGADMAGGEPEAANPLGREAR